MTEVADTKTFKALADPNRRMMLDLVKESPGMTVSDLTSHFHFTRYAVLKHLRVLEDAGLIVRRRNGKTKELYINAIPIQAVYDRWISHYSALWASRLTALKYELEKEESMTTETKLRQVYVLYIRTTPEKLWDAIVNPNVGRLADSAQQPQVASGDRSGATDRSHSLGRVCFSPGPGRGGRWRSMRDRSPSRGRPRRPRPGGVGGK